MDLPYRMIIAIATIKSVFLYDTEQQYPVATMCNAHYDRLTDLAWSADGTQLIISSIDGYCSVIVFGPDELGEPLADPTPAAPVAAAPAAGAGAGAGAGTPTAAPAASPPAPAAPVVHTLKPRPAPAPAPKTVNVLTPRRAAPAGASPPGASNPKKRPLPVEEAAPAVFHLVDSDASNDAVPPPALKKQATH